MCVQAFTLTLAIVLSIGQEDPGAVFSVRCTLCAGCRERGRKGEEDGERELFCLARVQVAAKGWQH